MPQPLIAVLGAGLEEYSVGQRVIVGAITPCGQCFYCLNGTHSQCGGALGGWRFGNTINGAWAEYLLVPDARANLAVIPDHVRQTEIRDSLRVSVGRPRIGKKLERRQHAHAGDRIVLRQAEPIDSSPCIDRIASRPGRVPTTHTGGDERHDAKAGGGFPKEIVREGSRPTTCRSGLRGGRVSRRPYEFRDLHHSAGSVRSFEVMSLIGLPPTLTVHRGVSEFRF